MLRRLIGEDITVITDLAPMCRHSRRPHAGAAGAAEPGGQRARRDARGGRLTIRTSLTTVEARTAAGPMSSRGATSRSRSPTPGRAWTPRWRTASSNRFSPPRRSARAPGWACPRCTASRSRAGATSRWSPRRGGGRFACCCPPRPTTGEHSGFARAGARAGPLGAGRVLLVEDDQAVRDLVGEVLARRAGCRHGRQPDRGAGQRRPAIPAIDLLVTDVVMPGMNGGELADALVTMRPDLRVLFITGYDDEDLATRGLTGPRP